MPPTTYALDENIADATKNEHVVIFDPATQTISSDKRSSLRGLKKYKAGRVSNSAHTLKIYTGRPGENSEVWLDFKKLSWSAWIRRHLGRCNDVYVLLGREEQLPQAPGRWIVREIEAENAEC